jgi:mycothiol S-conjugate amidase
MRAFAEARHEAGLISVEERDRMHRAGTPDEDVSAWIDIRSQLDRKFDALRAHRSQIPEDWWLFQVPEELRPDVFGRESYQRIFSRVASALPEDDLFAGIR